MTTNTSNNLFTKSLILDFGSGITKAGLSTDQSPSLFIDSYVGNRFPPEHDSPNQRVVGRNPSDIGRYTFSPLVKRGIIQNYDYFETLISKVLENLRVTSFENLPVLIAESVETSFRQKSKMAEILFEKFEANLIHFEKQIVLDLCAVGATTGCVLDLGHGLAQSGCLISDYRVTDSYIKSSYGGFDLENALGLLLRKRGVYFRPENERLCVKHIKETRLQVLNKNDKNKLTDGNFNIENGNGRDMVSNLEEMILPDGEEISLGNERFLVSELLFDPEQYALLGVGVQTMIKESINKCPFEQRRQLYQNIYITGGVANIIGFDNRLAMELKQILPVDSAFSINLHQEYSKHQAFTGGTVLSGVNQFNRMCVTRADFQEKGEQLFI